MKLIYLFCLVQYVLSANNISEEEEEEELSEEFLNQNDYSQILEQTKYGCVILTKYQLQSQSQDLLEIIKAQPTQQDQRRVYEKIQAQHVLQCLERISNSQLIDLFSSLRSQSFKVEDFSDIFMMMDFTSYKENQFTIDEQEAEIIKYIQDFDKKMDEERKKVKSERDEDDNDLDEEDEYDFRRPQRAIQQYNIFGVDINAMSQQSKMIILGIFALALAGLLYLGLKYVQINTQGPVKRVKKEKKNKQK